MSQGGGRLSVATKTVSGLPDGCEKQEALATGQGGHTRTNPSADFLKKRH
jgi:hypothetical protein